jgi:hypothetical protein
LLGATKREPVRIVAAGLQRSQNAKLHGTLPNNARCLPQDRVDEPDVRAGAAGGDPNGLVGRDTVMAKMRVTDCCMSPYDRTSSLPESLGRAAGWDGGQRTLPRAVPSGWRLRDSGGVVLVTARNADVADACATSVTDPRLSQHQRRLPEAGQQARPLSGAASAALGAQEPGQLEDRFTRNVEHGTIRNHAASSAGVGREPPYRGPHVPFRNRP